MSNQVTVAQKKKVLAEHVEVLRKFNEWRRWRGNDEDSPPMPDPRAIGIAIDAAIECMREAA